MAYSRSDFLTGALRFGAVSAVVPALVMDGRLAERVLASAARDSTQNILVVLQLAGGNDGLNTVIPYADGLYYQNRPTLAVPQKQVLPLTSQIGLHPNLTGLKALYDKGTVAIVQGVGYPNPNLSHFRSTDIWQSAQPIGSVDTGWLGRFLDASLAHIDNPLKAVALGPLLPKALIAAQTLVPAVQSLAAFKFLAAHNRQTRAAQEITTFQDIYNATTDAAGPYLSLVQLSDATAYQATIEISHAAHAHPSSVVYPKTLLGTQLHLVSQIIATNLGTRVFMVTQNGYDDHANEAQAHPLLLGQLSAAIAAFYQDMAAQGRAKQVVLMTFSEFGRRPLENASVGTDHGTAAPLFIVGGAVKGGLYGQTPSLSNLDAGNVKFSTDFRSVYSTVLSHWMGADPTPAVLGTFPTFPFL